ncbi:MAG: YdeI/OmpD-associated family protein [Ignavibacteriaceae bacterium]
MDEIKFFKTKKDFRKWLEKYHNKKTEQWVGFYKKNSGKPSIDWPQSVDEALCFGWIDGLRKSIDGESYKIRFTPRRQTSNWSAVNIKRVGELTKLGLMQPAGLKIFEARRKDKTNQYSFENRHKGLDPVYEKKIKTNKKAWEFFNSQPPSYRKTAGWWVVSAKREETRLKRLDILIKDSENGTRIALLRRPDAKKA